MRRAQRLRPKRNPKVEAKETESASTVSGEYAVVELATIFCKRELFRVGSFGVVLFFLLFVRFLFWFVCAGSGCRSLRCSPRSICHSHRIRFAVFGLGDSSLEF